MFEGETEGERQREREGGREGGREREEIADQERGRWEEGGGGTSLDRDVHL